MKLEQKALRISAVSNLLCAGPGVGFAWAANSDAILFDGIFSLVSFVMTLLTSRVASLAVRPPDEDFHFGYAYFEPLLNTAKGLVVLGICTLVFTGAVDSALAILLVLIVIRVPAGMVREGVRELLDAAPSEKMQHEVRTRFLEATRTEEFARTTVRMITAGRTLYVGAHVLLPNDRPLPGVEQLDEIRGRVRRALADLRPIVVSDVLFTADPAVLP